MEENGDLAKELLLLVMNLQKLCENTESKEFNKNVFSVKFKILLFVKEYGNISPSTLVSNLNIAKSNIAIFCKNLLSEGLIKSKHDEFDHRIIYYCLTPKGEKYVSSFVDLLDKHICLKLDEKQQKSMQKNIKAINGNLVKLGVK